MDAKDKLVQGPFGGNACYEQTFDKDGQQITLGCVLVVVSQLLLC